nr:hypothetical protein [Senegalia massiliensis]
MITVPYVVKAKQKVIDSLNLGVPVYIVGHLGSGKIQLSTEAALDFTIQKFGEFNEERKLYYKNILTNGRKKEIESL